MQSRFARGAVVVGSLVLVLFASSRCVDDRIVYLERDAIGELPEGHNGYVGMNDVEATLTVCGNCHVGAQGEWEQTAHAGAWATLQESGHAQAACEGCHTVNERGSVATEAGGYSTAPDARYHNVQCESCHGPGLAHIQNPGDTNIPLAPLAVGLELDVGCGECHQGSHHPFVEEWAQSGHGEALAYPAGRPECESCHSAEGALKAWGVRANFLEEEDVAQQGQHLAITCAVCHDPHDATNEKQLRFPVDVPNEEANLCMKCHHKRGTPDLANQRGPHSPQGPLLLGYAGWWPPNMQFTGSGDTARIAATHGSATNPKLCAGCHLNRFEVTDRITGEFIMQSTGHLFEATPCLDERGVPQAGGECTPQQKTFQTCAASGCHASQDVARSLQQVARQRLDLLAEQLDALLARVPATEFNTNDSRYTTGEGARFNHELATKFGGSAVHNPFLMEALLIASIRQVQSDYGLAPAAGLSLQPQLGVD